MGKEERACKLRRELSFKNPGVRPSPGMRLD